jgi:NAD(P)-dependent dehydrogenase (short-subunit alcohol dehydrogenase family)
MEDLVGKTAVITGAASGIGRAMAHRFGAEGMRLMVADIEAEPLAVVTAELTDQGFDVASFELDVRDLEQIKALELATRERFGNVHLLCNNAGVGSGGPVAGLDDLEHWRWTIDINLWGVIYGCKVFLPAMIAHGEPAHVVNTASMAGHVATPFMGAYNVSKYGVVALSETLTRELQQAGASVGVSVLCPAFVQTEIANSSRLLPQELQQEQTEEGKAMQEILDALVASGIETEVVATAVANAVINDTFWILTHEETKPVITARAQQIVDGVNPSLLGGLPQ